MTRQALRAALDQLEACLVEEEGLAFSLILATASGGTLYAASRCGPKTATEVQRAACLSTLMHEARRIELVNHQIYREQMAAANMQPTAPATTEQGDLFEEDG